MAPLKYDSLWPLQPFALRSVLCSWSRPSRCHGPRDLVAYWTWTVVSGPYLTGAVTSRQPLVPTDPVTPRLAPKADTRMGTEIVRFPIAVVCCVRVVALTMAVQPKPWVVGRVAVNTPLVLALAFAILAVPSATATVVPPRFVQVVPLRY